MRGGGRRERTRKGRGREVEESEIMIEYTTGIMQEGVGGGGKDKSGN